MIESIKKNKTGIILMIFSSFFACIGQLLWKLATDSGLIYLVVGFGLYGIGALLMLIAYKFGKVSVLQPVLSLNYVLSIFLAYFVLKEEITLMKFLGVSIIVLGVIMVAGGDTNESNS